MQRAPLLVVLVLAACGSSAPAPDGCDSWRQWGNSGSHLGASCTRGQPLRATLADMVYDPFIAQETADASGNLIIHYQTPLIDGEDLYMMAKKGTYTACNQGSNGPQCSDPDERYRLQSQIWSEQHFTVAANGSLTASWSYDSDWKPPPLFGFEPMFEPALAGDLIAIPGAGGTLWELDRLSGSVVRHVQPFGAVDPDTYVAGGLAVAVDGTIYYNAIKFDHDQPAAMPSQSWLVMVAPDGTPRTADYATLIPSAPAATASCFGTYDVMVTPLPWPPQNPDGSVIPPPTAPCGPQRPGVNATPAIGADGTIFVASRAHGNPRYSYVVAVKPDLTPKWATSLRDYLADGCGVTSTIDGTVDQNMFHCRTGTPVGLERVTGLAPAAQTDDNSSSTPVALPDGGVLYGAFTGYNGSRGHLLKLDRGGVIRASFDFGWDSTPAVFASGNDYKVVVKDNHYGVDENGVDLGPFYITELDSSLHVIWKFQSSNTQSCIRQPDGSKSCIDDHPNGFEWCINAPAVDRDGTVYANSEDGTTYAITSEGKLRDSVFLDTALGAAYTPIALDHSGRVFALNNGHLWVLGTR